MANPELRVLIELSSSDTRIGAVNDALDLAHYTRPLGTRVFLCGQLDAALRTLARQRGIPVVRGKSRFQSKLGFLLYVLNLAAWVIRLLWLRPHVVHINYVGHRPSLAWAAYLCRIPVVGRAGGAYIANDRSNPWFSAYAANCEPHAKLLLESPLASRVYIAGDLFRPDRLRENVVPSRPLPPRREGRTRFLFLGQLVERKGLAVLIEAFARMSTDADLLLVGGNWEDEGFPQVIRESIKAHGLGTRIYMENHRPDIAALLNQADVFVLPSLSDARPRSIIEAMMAGLPILSTTVGGIPTLVDTEVNGLLVEPNDADALAGAMDRLAKSVELRRSLGEAGRNRAATEFNPERTAARYVKLYRNLAASGA
jgi:glycosyltransferase involved in cell wall biosynthesis